jgi:flavin-dependent dehydrogenase
MPASTAPAQSQIITDPPDVLDTDVAIIGSGMGGGSLSYALRDSGADVLIIEQGDFLPVERENWSFDAVHLQGLVRRGHRQRIRARQLPLRGWQHEALRRHPAALP